MSKFLQKFVNGCKNWETFKQEFEKKKKKNVANF